MARLTPATRLWFIGLAVAVLALIAGPWFPRVMPERADWAALTLFGLCAAVAHRFPIRTAAAASYRLTNIFLVAGAIIVPRTLLPLLILAALVPDTLIGRRGEAIGRRLLVNVPSTAIAVLVAALWVARFNDGPQAHGLIALLVFGGAGALVTLVQNGLLAIGMALQFRLPPHRTDPLHPAALQADAVFAILGVAVAMLWRAEPAMLLVVLPLLILVHRLTRTASLAKLAEMDVKTGLYNARHFEATLEVEVARATRLGRPLAVLFVDLDHFKEVNDQHGHDAGDRVLHAFGTLMTGTLRVGDVVARFGGEEFVALLPSADPAEALHLAEQLRAATERHPFALPAGKTLHRTVSIGVATCPEDGTTAAALLASADGAMYRAKVTRNTLARVEVLPSVPRLHPANPAASKPDRGAAPPRRAGLTLWGTIVLGGGAFIMSLPGLLATPDWRLLAALVLLGVVAEFITIQVFENEQQRFSFTFSDVALLATVAALPVGAPLVAAIAALAHVIQLRQWRRGPGRALFNIASCVLAAGVAAGAYGLLVPVVAVYPWATVPAVAVATALYYVVNTGTIVLAMAAHTGRPLRAVIGDMRWATPVTLLLGFTGAFLGARFALLGPLNAALFVLPLLVMRHTLTFAARKSAEAITTLRAAKAEAEGAHEEKEQTLRQLIDVVAAIIDARDQAVAGHSARVATYSIALAEELALPERDRAYLHTAGLLHDLGKIAVPEAILHKPAKLTDEEFAVVKEHAAIGERILAEVRPLADVARMVGDHHERFDGAGYPSGEAGTTISLGGRIVAVADTLDSILSDRPYSKGKPLAWALEELDRCAGSHFDPVVVAALHRLVATRGTAFFTQPAESQAVSVAKQRGVLLSFPTAQPETPVVGARS